MDTQSFHRNHATRGARLLGQVPCRVEAGPLSWSTHESRKFIPLSCNTASKKEGRKEGRKEGLFRGGG